MDHKIRYTGGKKAGWTCECSCGESEDYRKAFARENCDRNHNDEWVEVDEATWDDLLDGTRLRREWEKGCWAETLRRFVHRDDLPDPDAEVRAGMESTDEWVEVDRDVLGRLVDLQLGARMRKEWTYGASTEPRLFVHRDDMPDADAEAVDALRNASWNIPRLDNGERPDPLPGLPEARALLTALHEAGFDVVRKKEG